MSYTKTIRGLLIIASGFLIISQAQAVPVNGSHGPQTSRSGPSLGGNHKKLFTCKRSLNSGFVSSGTQSFAIYGAKQVWTRKATQRYGKTYSFWGFSRKQRSSCKRDGAKYICKVSARPCNGGNVMKQ